MDERVDTRSSLYAMARIISPDKPRLDEHDHVDTHRHHCDSVIVFMGFEADGGGLSCEVAVGEQIETFASPASVFVPRRVPHTYRYLSGWGVVLNLVAHGNYNDSLV